MQLSVLLTESNSLVGAQTGAKSICFCQLFLQHFIPVHPKRMKKAFFFFFFQVSICQEIIPGQIAPSQTPQLSIANRLEKIFLRIFFYELLEWYLHLQRANKTGKFRFSTTLCSVSFNLQQKKGETEKQYLKWSFASTCRPARTAQNFLPVQVFGRPVLFA